MSKLEKEASKWASSKNREYDLSAYIRSNSYKEDYFISIEKTVELDELDFRLWNCISVMNLGSPNSWCVCPDGSEGVRFLKKLKENPDIDLKSLRAKIFHWINWEE
jgi:hypothetical protein